MSPLTLRRTSAVTAASIGGHDPTGGAGQDAVEGGEPGTAGRAAQHSELLPAHQDLQVLGGVIGMRLGQQASERADDQREYEQHRGWCEVPAHGADPDFRAPQGQGDGQAPQCAAGVWPWR